MHYAQQVMAGMAPSSLMEAGHVNASNFTEAEHFLNASSFMESGSLVQPTLATKLQSESFTEG